VNQAKIERKSEEKTGSDEPKSSISFFSWTIYTLAEAQMLSNFKKTPRDSATTLPSVQKNESCMTHNQNTCLNAF